MSKKDGSSANNVKLLMRVRPLNQKEIEANKYYSYKGSFVWSLIKQAKLTLR